MYGPPTLAGFITFVFSYMRVPPQYLPSNDPVIQWSFDVARAIVNPQLNQIQGCFTPPPAGSPVPSFYTMAVYNLGGDNLINYAVDQPGYCYFTDLRSKFDIDGFVGGVIDSASDEGTSEHMVTMDAYKNFTLANLQNLKTPWGRRYLALAQSAGPTTWGIS